MYETIKSIFSILYFILLLLALFGLISWITSLVSKKEEKRRNRQKYAAMTLICFFLSGVCMLASFATAVKQYQFRMSDLPTFAVSSDSLENGQWKDVITNTARGENKTPSLSWESVPGAEKYAVVMIDEDAAWLHWLALSLEKTSFGEGQDFEPFYSEYVGPYPPSGTHTYTVYVFAMKKSGNRPAADVDTGGQSIEKLASALDASAQMESGNIVAYGKISGSYTHQD